MNAAHLFAACIAVHAWCINFPVFFDDLVYGSLSVIINDLYAFFVCDSFRILNWFSSYARCTLLSNVHSRFTVRNFDFSFCFSDSLFSNHICCLAQLNQIFHGATSTQKKLVSCSIRFAAWHLLVSFQFWVRWTENVKKMIRNNIKNFKAILYYTKQRCCYFRCSVDCHIRKSLLLRTRMLQKRIHLTASFLFEQFEIIFYAKEKNSTDIKPNRIFHNNIPF